MELQKSKTNFSQNPYTNTGGLLMWLLSAIGVIALWFYPEHFHGSWTQIVLIFIAGAVLIFNMGDDFLKDIRTKFRAK